MIPVMPTESLAHLSAKEAAAYLTERLARTSRPIHPYTINNWVHLGLLTPAVKMPGLRGARYFTKAELDRFAKSLKVSS